MSQVLKEEVRHKIIAAAKDSFLQCGYDKTSMRSIASKAGITAGNMYRYFGGKEDLFNVVVSPVILAFDQMLIEESDNSLSIFQTPDNLDLLMSQFTRTEINAFANTAIDNLAERLNQLIHDHHDEINILLSSNEEVNASLSNWLKVLVKKCVPFFIEDTSILSAESELLYDCFGESVLHAIKYIISNKDLIQSESRVGDILKQYVKIVLRL